MSKDVDKVMEELAHELKIQYGLPPDRPTEKELLLIIKDIESIPSDKRTPIVWESIVHKHVKFYGMYLHEGADYSDINALHNEILNLLKEG